MVVFWVRFGSLLRPQLSLDSSNTQFFTISSLTWPLKFCSLCTYLKHSWTLQHIPDTNLFHFSTSPRLHLHQTAPIHPLFHEHNSKSTLLSSLACPWTRNNTTGPCPCKRSHNQNSANNNLIANAISINSRLKGMCAPPNKHTGVDQSSIVISSVHTTELIAKCHVTIRSHALTVDG